ncbi:MAG: peptidoglycan recognition family protein [Acidimicrobiia bacterium]|nr:peptidoglycan recognition family protein [Acidimicrobiia bacterium]
MRPSFRLIAFIVLLGLYAVPATAAPEPTPGGTFVDDDSTVHQGAIEAIADAGITRGCNPPLNTRFCPAAPVTRGQMAAFLSRALGLQPAPPANFRDTEDTIFAIDIDRLAAASITRGCNPPVNDRYCPSGLVTRGQMAAFLTRALQLPAASTDTFEDDDASLFEMDIEKLHAAGITRGCNPPVNDRFCPTRPVTRAEMAAFLARGLGLAEISIPPRPYIIDVVPRADWGAAEPRGTFTPHIIDRITIHHAGDLAGPIGPPQFRSWQGWHHYLGWPDLAYHFIVGRDGKVYEGRPYNAVGDTATAYDPTGHFLVVVEGNFDEDTPTTTQLELTAQLVAWAAMQFDIPLASSLESVSGHRDHAATSCPGDSLYAHIHDGSINSRARAILDAGGVTLNVPFRNVP